jgi:hypothetical protein
MPKNMQNLQYYMHNMQNMQYNSICERWEKNMQKNMQQYAGFDVFVVYCRQYAKYAK